ncbi:putative xylanase/chitin deacetylase [Allocoleopsis franciscana PCC 7113]|uniref:Putative xylanase/chitin deacetylase n=2 Tax=Allocoleopsis TaxID=2886347 RepID=K9WBX0_9CYAN|nr:putative xylanase/chitin deacetylase [Allocoleopsis franciscana PCC 7113]
MFMDRNIINILIVLFTVAFIFLGLKLLNKFSMSLKFQSFGELVNHVNTKDKVVALTYDDGPNPPYTNQLLEILERHQIKATFFVVGKTVEKYPDTLRLIVSKGHEIGNHSYSHKALISEKPGFIWSEIQKTDQLLRQLGVKDEIHFRAPYGRKLIVLPYLLAKLNKKNILWTIDTKDYEASNSEVIEASVLEQVRPGSIILMHDGGGERSRTVVATERLIENLKEKGYSFQTVSNLISKRSIIK